MNKRKLLMKALVGSKNISFSDMISLVEAVVPPRDWTPGEVKARKYNKPKKGGYYDTATTIYSGVQSASGARSAQWSTESGSTLSPASAQPTAACALEDRISGTSSPPF